MCRSHSKPWVTTGKLSLEVGEGAEAALSHSSACLETLGGGLVSPALWAQLLAQ